MAPTAIAEILDGETVDMQKEDYAISMTKFRVTEVNIIKGTPQMRRIDNIQCSTSLSTTVSCCNIQVSRFNYLI